MKSLTASFIGIGLLTIGMLSSPITAQAASDHTYIVRTSTTSPKVDERVSRDYRDDLGNVVRLTVTPPSGKRVDLNVLDQADFRIVAAESREQLLMLTNNAGPSDSDKVGRAPAKPVDMSGYTISMDLVTAASCSVSGKYSSGNSSVSAGSTTTFMSASAADMMTVTAYPLVGDVDVYTYYGSTLCGSSTRDAGYIDTHICYTAACNNTTTYYGKIKNYLTNSSSTYVASATAMWVN